MLGVAVGDGAAATLLHPQVGVRHEAVQCQQCRGPEGEPEEHLRQAATLEGGDEERERSGGQHHAGREAEEHIQHSPVGRRTTNRKRPPIPVPMPLAMIHASDSVSTVRARYPCGLRSCQRAHRPQQLGYARG